MIPVSNSSSTTAALASESALVQIGSCQVVRPVHLLPSVLAFTTCRGQGVSDDPYASFNLAHHVNDIPLSVEQNRRILAQLCGGYAPKKWLEQVHGCRVVKVDDKTASCAADAVWTDQTNSPCVVLTADCLPIVLVACDSSLVAVLHAGWRGLAADIIGETLRTLPIDASGLRAWLGPAIGPEAFEVGPDVQTTFLNAWGEAVENCFTEGRGDRFHANLWRLAAWRLTQLGVPIVEGGGWCTYNSPDQFYSFRRDGVTGRMATVAMLCSP